MAQPTIAPDEVCIALEHDEVASEALVRFTLIFANDTVKYSAALREAVLVRLKISGKKEWSRGVCSE